MTKSEFEKILTECCTELTKYMDDSLFVEYWGESVPPEKRIKRWLEKADEACHRMGSFPELIFEREISVFAVYYNKTA